MVSSIATELTAADLRRRVANRLANEVGGEAATFTFRTVEGVDYYHGIAGTGHLLALGSSSAGQPAFGGAVHEEQPEGWSVRQPKLIHSNRFVGFDEDHNDPSYRQSEAWKKFYEPAGIRDQARALFFADGAFIGWAAAVRGEADSFTDDELATLNRMRADVWDDSVLG